MFKLKQFTLIFALLIIIPKNILAWEGETHRGITSHVEKKECINAGDCIMNDYLENIGFKRGHNTFFTISDSYYIPPTFLKRTTTKDPITRKLCIKETSRTALDWVVEASAEEDCPLTRANHHFHDPTTLKGWDEEKLCPEFIKRYGTMLLTNSGYSDEAFICKGVSARPWNMRRKDA